MSELANNKSIRKEVNDLGETLGITPKGKNNQQKIRSIGEQASDGTYATKEYVNTLMSGALKRQIVETLPVEDIDTNTIYMVLDSQSSQQGNVYNEYLYINEAWELIGTTEVSGGGSELGEVITINSTNFELYDDSYFGTSIGAGLYRLGIIFKNKTTNEKYCIICNIDTDPSSIDWGDPNIFNISMGFVRGGDLVLKLGGSYFTKMGVVCQYTTSGSTETKIQMLK